MSAKLASYTGAAVVIMVLLLIKATLVLIITLFQCHFPSNKKQEEGCKQRVGTRACHLPVELCLSFLKHHFLRLLLSSSSGSRQNGIRGRPFWVKQRPGGGFEGSSWG
jgi:hypothetical protein